MSIEYVVISGSYNRPCFRSLEDAVGYIKDGWTKDRYNSRIEAVNEDGTFQAAWQVWYSGTVQRVDLKGHLSGRI